MDCFKTELQAAQDCLLGRTVLRRKEGHSKQVLGSTASRFKRTIEKSGLLTELRAREFYEKHTAERKRKKSAAIKRHLHRMNMSFPLLKELSVQVVCSWINSINNFIV